MKIKTKLWIISCTALMLAASIVFLFIWSKQQLHQAQARYELVTDLVNTALIRTALRDEYLLNHDERPKLQWQQQTDKLSALIKSVELFSLSPENSQTLKQIVYHLEKTKTYFSHIVENYEGSATAGISPKSVEEIEKRLVSQIIIEVQLLFTELLRLEKTSLAEYTAIESKISTVTTLALILLAVFTAVTLFMLSRNIIIPLNRLGKGIKALSSGKLDYRVASESNDEIGELSRAFDKMISKLREVTVSRDELSEEIKGRTQAEFSLRESRAKLDAAFSSMTDAVFITSVDGSFIDFNEAFATFHRYQSKSACAGNLADLRKNIDLFMDNGEWAPLEMRPVSRALRGETVTNAEYTLVSKDTGESWVGSYSFAPIRNEDGVIVGSVVVGRDVTEIKQAQETKSKLEEQLLQSQKMESVGRLAGGVAHDFNNMLGVIIGHSELAMMKLEPAQPLYSSVTEIRKAAERSADLTRQLLAFARKQTIAPKVIDLNDTVTGMLKMLQRLIGEDIHLTWQPAPGLWSVKVDPSQIDQILANLCVNSRDAITDVGKITIETGNATIDESHSTPQKYVEPGEYVRLVVSDDGRGMDKETVAVIFEPFFTTKGVGQGTGLGLSTVYGIIKQNKGFINVYSEPGHGTTFSIYLPRQTGESLEVPKKSRAESIPRGSETILLVEDEPSILSATAMLLEGLGYAVLKAGTAAEAIRLFNENASTIHLLITDVVMPDMNGRDLSRELQSRNSQLNCLFMSGYTANVIAHHGVLDDGVNFIQKPFSLADLAAKVREAMDGELEIKLTG